MDEPVMIPTPEDIIVAQDIARARQADRVRWGHVRSPEKQAQAEYWDELQEAAQTILDISTCEDSPITGDAAMAALQALRFGLCRMRKNLVACDICPTIPNGQLPGDLTPEELLDSDLPF